MARIRFGWPGFFALVFLAQAWNIAVGLGDAPRERLFGHAAFESGGYLFGDGAFYAAAADSHRHSFRLQGRNRPRADSTACPPH